MASADQRRGRDLSLSTDVPVNSSSSIRAAEPHNASHRPLLPGLSGIDDIRGERSEVSREPTEPRMYTMSADWPGRLHLAHWHGNYWHSQPLVITTTPVTTTASVTHAGGIKNNNTGREHIKNNLYFWLFHHWPLSSSDPHMCMLRT